MPFSVPAPAPGPDLTRMPAAGGAPDLHEARPACAQSGAEEVMEQGDAEETLLPQSELPSQVFVAMLSSDHSTTSSRTLATIAIFLST